MPPGPPSYPTHCEERAELCILDPARIRVLLLPIGRIAPHRFQYYVQLFKRFSVVPVNSVTDDTAEQVLHESLPPLGLPPVHRSQSSPGNGSPSAGNPGTPVGSEPSVSHSEPAECAGSRASLDESDRPRRIQPVPDDTTLPNRTDLLLFDFIDQVDNASANLEHLQTYRQTFGVVGIMELTEPAKHDSRLYPVLENGYAEFQGQLDHLPNALVSRCVVFRTRATSSADGTTASPKDLPPLSYPKGLLPVNATGDPLPGVATVMNGLTAAMRAALHMMTEALETQNYVPPSSLSALSPTITSGPPLKSPTFASYMRQRSAGSTPTLIPTDKGDFATDPSAKESVLPDPSPEQTPSSAAGSNFFSSVLRIHTNFNQGPSGSGSTTGGGGLSLASLVSPSGIRRSTPALAVATLNPQAGSVGKIKKLMGDACLMMGKYSEAISYYSSSIEHAKTHQDYLWQAAAFEGYYAALALLAFCKSEKALLMALLSNPIPSLVSGMLPSDSILPPSDADTANGAGVPGGSGPAAPTSNASGGTLGIMPPGTGPTAGNNSFSPLLHNSPPSNTSKTRAVSSSTANLLQSSLRNSTQMAYFVLSELVDKYREIPLLYEQAAVFSPILHNEACFRMADLALLVRWGGLSEDTLVRLVLRGASPSTLRHYEPVVQGRWKDPPATPLYRRITRGQVGAWILRGWNDEAISSLGLQEQLHLIQQMVCLFDRSGLQRKKGFFMYQLSVLLQQLVHPPDVKGSPSTKITGLGGGPTHTTVTSTLAVLDEMLAVYYLSRFYPTNAGPLSEGLLFDSQRLVKALQATVLSKIGRRHDKAGNKPTLSGSRLLYSQSHLWHALQDAVLSQSIQLCRNLGLVQPAIVYSLMLINLLWLYGNREPFSLLGTTDKMSLDMHLSQLAHQLHTMVLKLYSKYPPWFVSPRILSVRNTSKSSDHTLRCPSKLLSSSDSKAGWLFFQSTDINLPRLDSALLNGVPIVHDTFQRLLLRLVIRPSEDPARRCYPSIFNAEVREWYADFVQSTTTDRNVTTPEHAAANPFIYHAQTAAPTTKSALGGRRKSGHSMGPWHPRVPQGPCDEGEQWLVSKEPSDVTVELWNPFPFVLVVSDVALVAYRVTAPPATEPLSTEPSDTVLLSPLPSSQCPTSNKSCVISPGQTQVFRLPLQVEDQTQRVVVHGCVVKLFSHLQVHLVPEVEDPTFGTPDVKSGVGPEITHESHLVSKVTPLLVPDVIPPMPILTAVDSSFPDPNVALDLIEGETRTLSLTLHNGGHAPVNYLRWQFIGITMAGTKHVLRPKAVDMDLLDCSGRDQQSPLPIQYQGHTVGDSPSPHGIPVRRNNACNPRLDPEWLPGETRNLHFSVTAQTDYCRIEVQAEYGQVDRLALVVDHWYQRKFNFSLSLQVHPALVVTHFQLQHLPPRHLYRGLGIGLSNDTLLSCSLDNVAARTLAFVSQQSVDQSESTHGDPWSTETQDHWCLAQIDLRNPNNESVNIEVDITAKLSQYFPNLHGPSEQDSPCFHAKATCPPGETARLLLPVPRFQLPDTVTCQAIPVRLTHGEYVIQQTDKDQTTAQQTLTKALYWYRRALFTHLGLRWSTQRMDGQATGLLQVDRIPFSPSLLHILRGPDCLLMARLQSAVAPADHLDNVLEHRDGTAVCSVGQCVTLCVTIRNRSPVAQQGSLRVLPSIPRSPNQQLLGTTRLPLHGDTANGIHTTGTGDLSTQLPQVWATLNHEDGWSSTAEFLDEGVQWSHQSRYPLGMLAPGSTKSINVPFYFDLPGLYTLQYGWEQYSHANSRIMHQLQVQVVAPSSFCKGE